MRNIAQEPDWLGGALDDQEVFARLPADLGRFLARLNGFVRYGGGFHLRGAVHEPRWHSLRSAWLGDDAFHRHYTTLTPDDVPFAQEATGDQFILRQHLVYRLSAETDELDCLDLDLSTFLEAVAREPVGTLLLQPLLAFRQQGGCLAPGELLNSYPPFCFKEAAAGPRYAAVPAHEQFAFLVQLSSKLRGLPADAKVNIRVVR